MIIEWIGCSGTGKTTLREEVYKNLLSSGIDVRRPLEIFLGRSFAKTVSNESIRNIILDVLVLPWSLWSLAKHRQFYKFSLSILNSSDISVSRRIRLIRSIFRKIGLYVFLKGICKKEQLILFDEGTVHIAQFLFANGNKIYSSENEIKRFCDLVPTPDLIVQIMAPESDVIERTLNRKDLPAIDPSPESLKNFIVAAQNVFKSLNDLKPWPKKTITFLNPNTLSTVDSDKALKLTEKILTHLPSHKNAESSLNS